MCRGCGPGDRAAFALNVLCFTATREELLREGTDGFPQERQGSLDHDEQSQYKHVY